MRSSLSTAHSPDELLQRMCRSAVNVSKYCTFSRPFLRVKATLIAAMSPYSSKYGKSRSPSEGAKFFARSLIGLFTP